MTALAPDNIGAVGIEMVYQERPQITDNHIAGISSDDVAVVGIDVGLTRFLIKRETSNAIITGNVIEELSQTDDRSVIGIGIASGGSGTAVIANNSISSLQGDTSGSDITAGIAVYGQPGSTTKVYFNSVSMSGTPTGGSPSSSSPVALLLGLGDPTVDVRNNVLANTTLGSGPNNFVFPGYALGLSSESAANLSSDHNAFFVPPGSPSGIAISGFDSISSNTVYNSLGEWQTFSGTDGASLATDPEFVSTSDLRPAVGSVLLNNGTQIAGFTTDIERVTRNPVTPTIGAYEQAVAPLSAIETWRLTHFGTGANAGDAANNFDFDHDGIVNLIEFAFGLDPLSSDSVMFTLPQKIGTNFGITLTQPSGVSGITYAAESSSTLAEGSWEPVPNTGTASQIEFIFPPAPGSFMRLIISEP
jgi:hypothetical protein